jgi:fructan beta-fructosidase
MKYVIDGQTVREFDIELADGEQPDFWAFADVSEFKGKTLAVETVLTSGSKSLEAIVVADDVPQAEKLYREKHRPLFHFTSRFGWLNDPNGLVFVPRDGKAGTDGEWHMFYQHNPFGVNWGNMHWGHAVSEDLMHWRELGIGLYPKNYGDWAFSGSAIIDTENTSGWGTKDAPPLVLAYTSTARGECIAYSKDKGRTWKEHDRNPVVKHSGRDPKLLWHEKTKHWVMAVYDEFQGKQWIAFYTSPDLKTWTFASRIEGFFECPDLYELPYESAQLQQFKSGKWVLSAADGKYLTGKFDGKEFKPDSREKKQLWYGHFYAAQTFNDFVRPQQFVFDPPRLNLPSSPLIQIGWENGVSFPGMSFNQQMSIPVSLSWWSINLGDAPRLRAIPFNVESLHEKEVELSIDVNDEQAGRNWGPDKPGEVLKKPLAENLDAFDLETEIELGNAKKITFDLRGTKLGYDVAAKKLSCKDVSAPLSMKFPTDLSLPERLVLRILVDRGSIEVFADRGLVAMVIAAVPDEKNKNVELRVEGGDIIIRKMSIYRMKSSWEK